MREIKFRGKDAVTKEWVYGAPYTKAIFSREHKKIIGYKTYFITYLADDLRSVERIEVDRNTVGQFTGLYDKNGKEIYEGDVVKLFYYDGNSKDQLGNVKGIDNIIFVDGCFKLENETAEPPIGYDNLGKCRFTEIIGNIHDR